MSENELNKKIEETKIKLLNHINKYLESTECNPTTVTCEGYLKLSDAIGKLQTLKELKDKENNPTGFGK